MEYKYVYNMGPGDEFDQEDLEGRRLYINTEVDSCIIDTIVYHVMRFNREDKELPIEERKPIYLYINTPGGSVSDGYALIDAIITSKTPVYTINQGIAMSMGFLIFIAGHKRFAMPHSEFLMHDGSVFSWDSTAKAKDRLDFETNKLEKMTKDFIIEHTKIDEKLYESVYRKEWYLLPDDAKEYGIVDSIVGVDCEIDEVV